MNMSTHMLSKAACDCITMLNTTRKTIKTIAEEFNQHVKQVEGLSTFNIPTDYKRKAHLIADLESIALQLGVMKAQYDPLITVSAMEMCEELAVGLSDAVQAANELIADVESRRYQKAVQDLDVGDLVVNPITGILQPVFSIYVWNHRVNVAYANRSLMERFEINDLVIVEEPASSPEGADHSIIPFEKEHKMTTQFKSLNAVSIGEVFVTRVNLSHLIVWVESEYSYVVLHSTIENGITGSVSIDLLAVQLDMQQTACVVGSAKSLLAARVLCEMTNNVFNHF